MLGQKEGSLYPQAKCQMLGCLCRSSQPHWPTRPSARCEVLEPGQGRDVRKDTQQSSAESQAFTTPTSALWFPPVALPALLSFLKPALTLQLSRKPPLASARGSVLCRSQILNLWVGTAEAEFGLTLRKNFLAISSPGTRCELLGLGWRAPCPCKCVSQDRMWQGLL